MIKVMKHIKNFFHRQDGVAATEFAILSPVLIMILVGVIDGGLYINEKMKTEMSARSMVEYLLNGGDEANIMDNVLVTFFEEETEVGEEPWQDSVVYENEEICECAGGVEIACTESCDGGDFRRRYLASTVTKTHYTLFPYPGLPTSLPIDGHARIQKD